MIGGIKSMIAGCIERMRQRNCETCGRRDNCAFLWPEALGFALASADRATRARREPAADRTTFRAFLREVARAIETSMKPHQTPFRREVERRLEPLLASGQVRIGHVARDLGCSRQTLYRRLKAEGTTFEEVLNLLRRRLALRLMRDQGLSVKETAWRLGFSDPTAFSRAFKRWTGTSPRDVRKAPRPTVLPRGS